MKELLIKIAVRIGFRLKTRDQASRQIRKALERYLQIAEMLRPDEGLQPVRVPAMLGIDEDMRNWSFFMILEHNVIVNRSITVIVQSLARDREPEGSENFDPKKDVMPSTGAGEEQLEAFRTSVEKYLASLFGMARLRGTLSKRHPVFGALDAHGWHCMFGLHLRIHLRQAEAVARAIKE